MNLWSLKAKGATPCGVVTRPGKESCLNTLRKLGLDRCQTDGGIGHSFQGLFDDVMHLAVGQGIHRIDDDGAGAGSEIGRPGFQDAIHHGNEERQGFSGTCSGCYHIASFFLRLGDGLGRFPLVKNP